MDVFKKIKRSQVMQQVKSSGNKTTEVKLISFFKTKGIIGWKRNYQVKGHPDFVFLKEKIAVFVDGCFWHGHDCRNTRPASNSDFWKKKRQYNIEHDAAITNKFLRRGWKVIRIWECELKPKNLSILEAKLASIINENK